MMTYDNFMLALCIWREARGAPEEARRAIQWVVLNRVTRKFRGTDVPSVITSFAQFSSFNPSDINSTKFPVNNPRNAADWKAWIEIQNIVLNPNLDPTMGAVMYHDNSVVPSWAEPNKKTAEIGPFSFYRA